MHLLTDPQAWLALVTLTILEIVLGVDNIIFISILSGKLPAEQRAKARQMGLALALITRVGLLLSLSWVLTLTKPLIEFGPVHLNGRDLILLLGGLFLLWKSVHEIHNKLEGEEVPHGAEPKAISFNGVIAQILILDVVFSLDSVITAVGMAKDVEIMIAAVVIAVAFMLVFAGSISNFVEEHPTIKMLALAFLVLIGVNLVAEGFHQHIPKGYIYFAMAFSVGVELLNIRAKKKSAPLHLRDTPHEPAPGPGGY
jgi:predicted tellurium resistance membrane protein TerC